MKILIKMEEAGFFLLGFYLFMQTSFPWWTFFALLFLPDIFMAGYLINNRLGAIVYNIGHHRVVAILFFIAGMQLPNETVTLTGIILFSHSSLDRVLDYGLKHFKGFKYTNLGEIASGSR